MIYPDMEAMEILDIKPASLDFDVHYNEK